MHKWHCCIWWTKLVALIHSLSTYIPPSLRHFSPPVSPSHSSAAAAVTSTDKYNGLEAKNLDVGCLHAEANKKIIHNLKAPQTSRAPP